MIEQIEGMSELHKLIQKTVDDVLLSEFLLLLERVNLDNVLINKNGNFYASNGKSYSKTEFLSHCLDILSPRKDSEMAKELKELISLLSEQL